MALKRPCCKSRCKRNLTLRTVMTLVVTFWSLSKTAQDSLSLAISWKVEVSKPIYFLSSFLPFFLPSFLFFLSFFLQPPWLRLWSLQNPSLMMDEGESEEDEGPESPSSSSSSKSKQFIKQLPWENFLVYPRWPVFSKGPEKISWFIQRKQNPFFPAHTMPWPQVIKSADRLGSKSWALARSGFWDANGISRDQMAEVLEAWPPPFQDS